MLPSRALPCHIGGSPISPFQGTTRVHQSARWGYRYKVPYGPYRLQLRNMPYHLSSCLGLIQPIAACYHPNPRRPSCHFCEPSRRSQEENGSCPALPCPATDRPTARRAPAFCFPHHLHCTSTTLV